MKLRPVVRQVVHAETMAMPRRKWRRHTSKAKSQPGLRRVSGATSALLFTSALLSVPAPSAALCQRSETLCDLAARMCTLQGVGRRFQILGPWGVGQASRTEIMPAPERQLAPLV